MDDVTMKCDPRIWPQHAAVVSRRCRRSSAGVLPAKDSTLKIRVRRLSATEVPGGHCQSSAPTAKNGRSGCIAHSSAPGRSTWPRYFATDPPGENVW